MDNLILLESAARLATAVYYLTAAVIIAAVSGFVPAAVTVWLVKNDQ